jgi:integrase
MSVPRKPGTSSPKPRKSPLRVAALPRGVSPSLPRSAQPSSAEMAGEQPRAMMISEFCQWLRPGEDQAVDAVAGLHQGPARGDWGGKAKSFADVRDHALIRVLSEGLRRTEVVQMQMDDLPADLILQPVIRVVALKGARADDQGRLVPLSHATARALSSSLRARRYHRYAASPYVWLGQQNHGPMNGTGLYRMLRRADQAGYDPRLVHPHMFRHTFANDFLQRRRRGRPHAPGRLEGPFYARPLRRRHGPAARHRRQAPHG